MADFLDKWKAGFKGWDFKTIAWAVILIFIILQAFGLLFANFVTIKLGSVLLFALIAVAVLAAASMAKKQWAGGKLDKEDFIAVLVLAIIAILAVIYLPKFAPQIFATASEGLKHDLQAVIPLP